MNNQKSKHQQIKEHLQKGCGISGLYALQKFGVYRLSSVINRLRNKGMNIETTMINDGGDTYARYILVNPS